MTPNTFFILFNISMLFCVVKCCRKNNNESDEH